MKVKEARQEIQHIQETIEILHQLPEEQISEAFLQINDVFPNANWNTSKLHIINGLCAYKNILKERIESADI